MTEISEGRVVELPKATEEQRKAIGRVVSTIRVARVMTYESIFAAANGSLQGYALEDEKNLGKGSIAQWKAAKLFRWIVENHLPLGCEIAPEVFDPSLLTRWRDFIRAHGIYDRLSFCFADGLGLTQRSSKQPMADTPIPMGCQFLFELDCGIGGQLLALEATGGNTYPFSLHPNETSLFLDVEAATQVLPLKANGMPDPLSETEHKGLRCYLFLIAAPDVMEDIAKGLHEAHPIKADKLDQIAAHFVDKEGNPTKEFELHRLNVVFSG